MSLLDAAARTEVRHMALMMRSRHDTATVTDEALVEALTAAWNEYPNLSVEAVAEAALLARRTLRKAALARRRGLRLVK